MKIPALEQSIQKRFFALARGDEKAVAGLYHGMECYVELVYERFNDVLSLAYPILKSHVTETEWERAVRQFVKKPPASPYIWEAPDAFRGFAKRLFLEPWAKDLMWFEWMEIEVCMQPSALPLKMEMSLWDMPLALAPSVRLKTLSHAVHRKEGFAKKGRFPILLYCHKEDGLAYYYEITRFLLKLLKSLNGKTPLLKLLKAQCKEAGVDVDEVRGMLESPLAQFARNGILESR